MRQIHGVQVRHRGKRQPLAIRRLYRVHDQTHLHRPLLYSLRKIQLWTDVLRNLRREGNYFFVPASEIEPPDFPILVINNFFASRQKRKPRKYVAREPRFLIVARHWIFHPMIFARFQIAQPQTRFRFKTRHVYHLFSIRRQCRPECALRLRDNFVFIAGLPVPPHDLP